MVELTMNNLSETRQLVAQELEKTKATEKEIARAKLLLEETFMRLKTGIECLPLDYSQGVSRQNVFRPQERRKYCDNQSSLNKFGEKTNDLHNRRAYFGTHLRFGNVIRFGRRHARDNQHRIYKSRAPRLFERPANDGCARYVPCNYFRHNEHV